MNASRTAVLAFAALACAHCGDDAEPTPTPGQDIGVDAVSDAADGTGDVGVDAADTGEDVGRDAGDVGTDGDGGTDVDTGQDVDVDVAPEMVAIGGETIDTAMAVALRLSVNGEAVEDLVAGPGEPYVFETLVAAGTPFAVEAFAHPRFLFCTPEPSAETAEIGVTVDVRCRRGLRIETSRWRVADDGTAWLIQNAALQDESAHFRNYQTDALGLDGIPFTVDDPDAQGAEYVFARDGSSAELTYYVHVGDDGAPWTEDDVIEGIERFEVGIRATRSLEAVVESPGVDGLWRTDDDVMSTNSRRSVLFEDLGEDGTLECRAEYRPGPDGRFGTDDDVLDAVYWRSAERNEVFDAYPVTWSNPARLGDDGEPCTGDDEFVLPPLEVLESLDGLRRYSFGGPVYTESLFAVGEATFRTVYRPAGGVPLGPDADPVESYGYDDVTLYGQSRSLQASDPGRDRIWFTPDDAFRTLAPYREYDPYTGDDTLQVSFRDGRAGAQGPDGVWGTRDDLASSWEIVTETDDLRCWVVHSDAGADAVWDVTTCGNDASDDTIEEVEWVRSEDGRAMHGCISTGPGDDGVWATTDDSFDRLDNCFVYEWVTDQRAIVRELDSAGDDGDVFTDDDTYGGVAVYEYDEDGRIVLQADATGPGDDGEWFTGDDEIDEGYERLELDPIGQVTRETVYGVGDDGEWFTEDDPVIGEETYAAIPAEIADQL